MTNLVVALLIIVPALLGWLLILAALAKPKRYVPPTNTRYCGRCGVRHSIKSPSCTAL